MTCKLRKRGSIISAEHGGRYPEQSRAKPRIPVASGSEKRGEACSWRSARRFQEEGGVQQGGKQELVMGQEAGGRCCIRNGASPPC